MADGFEVTELVRLFRSGLLALLPAMDAARIRWAPPGVYDPWEDIERTLFTSIVGSCVENATPEALPPLASYGLTRTDYSDHSFISERGLRLDGTLNALVELRNGEEPFDTALLHELDASLTPTGRLITKQIETCAFDLAGGTAAGINYRGELTYLE
jgi:hypothetical protein